MGSDSNLHAVSASDSKSRRKILLQMQVSKGGKQMHGQHEGSNQTFLPEVGKAFDNSYAWITGSHTNEIEVVRKAWQIGDRVQLHGLQQDEFNGLTGKISAKPALGTWRVALDVSGRRIDVDTDHLGIEVLKPGVHVQLQGLKDAAFNNKTGRLKAYVPTTKRWIVQMDGKKKKEVQVKYSNIDVQAIFKQWREDDAKKKREQAQRKKEINALLKKAKKKRDKREHVEKIEKDTTVLGMHPLQAFACVFLFCMFVFWYNKLFTQAWAHTWGIK